MTYVQKTYHNMDIKDAIEMITNHKLNVFNFLKAECKHKKKDVVDVVEYYSKN